jgi:predicted amidohydrolase
MIIALASPRVAASIDDGLETADRLVAEAASRGAEVVCFPEAWLPGLRGLDFPVPHYGAADEARVVAAVAESARRHGVATVMGMEKVTEAGRQIAALVVDARGEVLGWQTKNQLDPTEEPLYVPGDTRRLFEVNGVRFGVAICHEAFRYPETVRWAAIRGAQVVFHPHCTGSDRAGANPPEWGAPSSPYYEKAMMCRGLENGIFFASVNYAFRWQDSATTIISPSGACLAHLPYGEEGVLVLDLDLSQATGLLASRYAPERYREATA